MLDIYCNKQLTKAFGLILILLFCDLPKLAISLMAIWRNP